MLSKDEELRIEWIEQLGAEKLLGADDEKWLITKIKELNAELKRVYTPLADKLATEVLQDKIDGAFGHKVQSPYNNPKSEVSDKFYPKVTVEPIPPPAWEVFDICDKCGTDEGKPCYDLRKSSSKKLVVTTSPHKGRKQLK